MIPEVTVVFGAGSIGNKESFISDEDLGTVFKILKRHNIRSLDSGQLYGNSEARLGEMKAGDSFDIDTKWLCGHSPGFSTKANILSSSMDSLRKLGIEQADIFYLHCPDDQVPISETLAGVDEAYKLGHFRRFGLSNYLVRDVQAVYDHCKENGYVLPTVYQGNYNAVTRLQETVLLPTLRKLNIAFYAYSPIAGGLLTKSRDHIEAGLGRFGTGTNSRIMYGRPAYLDALKKWEEIASEEGISRAELAYRWVAYHSALKKGDAIVIGSGSLGQLEDTLVGLERGPLSQAAAAKIYELWGTIMNEAPLDNIHKTWGPELR
ncbi:aldehyde reductase [Xylariales sp. PMI_506]|nr:aldehyde reductase [Xylariales sp. PMI_506]